MAISCLKRGSEKLWRLALACLRSRFSLCPLWVSIFYLTRHRKNVLHPPVTCRRWLQSEKWKKPFFHTGNPRIGLRFESAAKTASEALQPSDSGRSDAHTMPLEMLCRRQKLPQRCDVERLCTKQRERQSHRRRPANSIGQGMQGAFFYGNSPVSIPPSLSIRMQFAKNFSTRSKSELLSLFRKTKPKLNSLSPKMTFSPFGTQQLFGIQKHQIAIQVVIEKTFPLLCGQNLLLRSGFKVDFVWIEKYFLWRKKNLHCKVFFDRALTENSKVDE